ncbi:electron transport complex protein RnfE [Pseudomonas protegens]|uniref:Rnf-Nqr domain containing protein n=1 Tax=Pseudomonas TaxID=286 RepID=UPI000F4A1D38|nr:MULTISPECIES: Rnf-Nqr domain containing protein [Pseudomonas]MBP5124631.1 NADH:quinone oxidoreductase [Pseudomonas protegens]MCS4261987.1 electron transport complex protein RnfE [Pseudomonas sp. BIGb0176]NTZ75439.1 NADH:quinone oxidoreductase [Pseudomonas protegens]QEN49789.1 NADH:quinone oxidoreductase [Pseudomonas protegens]ROQ50728.1 electron transport complex protein RnfE [Pseudomonas protegens]
MNKPLSLPGLLMLPPLIGATDSWVKAIGLTLAWVLLIGLYGAGMRLLRPPIEARHHWLASLLLSASLGSCLWLALQAWSYELHQQLSLYLGLLPLQCVVLEQAGFFQHRNRLRLAGAFCVALIGLGALRELLGAGTLGSHLGWLVGQPDAGSGWVVLPHGGLRLLTLAPGGFILLGALLAAKRAWAGSWTLNRPPSRK